MSTISECIHSSNNSIKAVGENFIRAIKCSGIASADFAGIFEVKEDSNTINALSEYRKEKVRVERNIADINQSISNAQSTIEELNSKIRSCDSVNYSQQIRSASSQMDSARSAANRATDARAREEAQSQYRSAQRRKEQAEAAQRTNDRNRADYTNQKSATQNALNDYRGQKTNLEKRLRQVEEIINLF